MNQYQCPTCLENYYRIDDRLIRYESKEFHPYFLRHWGMWAYYDDIEQGYIVKLNNICCHMELP